LSPPDDASALANASEASVTISAGTSSSAATRPMSSPCTSAGMAKSTSAACCRGSCDRMTVATCGCSSASSSASACVRALLIASIGAIGAGAGTPVNSSVALSAPRLLAVSWRRYSPPDDGRRRTLSARSNSAKAGSIASGETPASESAALASLRRSLGSICFKMSRATSSSSASSTSAARCGGVSLAAGGFGADI
jgi:hypothetical protein